ncbi:MAG: protein kinase [Pseudomonadota bacterium]
MQPQQIVKFGSYYLTRKIATGGMAELFRARKVGAAGFEKLVAIKRLLPHLAADDEFRSMFLDEAKLASQLNQQNIVQVYDLGRMEDDDSLPPGHQGTYFIAMEYIFGKSLAEVIKKGQERGLPLPPELAARVILAAANGLAYAHAKKDETGQALGLVHRDVSPQNILLSYEGEVKLVDFGIAKALSQSSTTRPGMLKGKFAYMPPEQARGEAVDQRADIYALGVVFWEALTNNRLFTGDTEAAILNQVLNPQVTQPSQARAEVPPELDELCLHCLTPDPAQRYQQAEEFSQALEAYLHGLKTFPSTYSLRSHLYTLFGPEIEAETQQIQEEMEAARQACEQHAATAGTGAQTASAPGASTAPQEATRLVAPAPRKGRGLVYAAAGAALVAAVGLGWWLMGTTPGQAPPAPAAPAQPVATAAPTTGTPSAAPAAPVTPATPPTTLAPSPAAPAAPPPDPHLLAAREQIKQGHFQAALAGLEQASAADPQDRQELARAKARAYLGLASQKLESSPQEALADLEQAARLAPDWAEVHYQTGRVQTRLKQFDLALAAYDRALELDPKLDGAHFNRGYILLEQGRLEKALPDFQRVVDLGSPYAADAQVNLAVCSWRLGQKDEAIKRLQAALVLNPNHKLALSYLEKVRKAGNVKPTNKP